MQQLGSFVPSAYITGASKSTPLSHVNMLSPYLIAVAQMAIILQGRVQRWIQIDLEVVMNIFKFQLC